MLTAYDFSATTIDGGELDLHVHRGKVLLVVNTASKCGFTPQYEGLERLHETYTDRGLVVLGFPCDQFGNQEPGDEAQIKSFCSLTYAVKFTMFAKVEVNGDDAHPLFAWLRAETPGPDGDAVEWNFTKFLVDTHGRAVRRYGTRIQPDDLAPEIEGLLPAS